jgi:hypothetical protein
MQIRGLWEGRRRKPQHDVADAPLPAHHLRA